MWYKSPSINWRVGPSEYLLCLPLQEDIGDKFLRWCKIPPSTCTLYPWWSFSGGRLFSGDQFWRHLFPRLGQLLGVPQEHPILLWSNHRDTDSRVLHSNTSTEATADLLELKIVFKKFLISWLVGVHSFHQDNGSLILTLVLLISQKRTWIQLVCHLQKPLGSIRHRNDKKCKIGLVASQRLLGMVKIYNSAFDTSKKWKIAQVMKFVFCL